MIEYRNIVMKYNDKLIIDDFNLKIDSGEFITIVGSSGSGKTTIMKMINQLVIPNAGSVLIDNIDIKDFDLIQLRRKIGYVVQGSVLFPHLDVSKNISYVSDLESSVSKVQLDQQVEDLLVLVGLDSSFKKRNIDELSGGQQQRVGIARALCNNPSILLMDEPFGAVDEITRSLLQDQIRTIHSKSSITILFVTHDIHEALSLGSRVVVMNEGIIEQFDTPSNIINNPSSEYVKMLIDKGYNKGYKL